MTTSCTALVVALTACSGGDTSDAVDGASPGPDSGAPDSASPEADSETTADDDSEPEGEPDSNPDGSATIGGAETGLTLEIPDEWVDVPMDAEMMAEGLESLDLSEDQAEILESSISALGSVDGAVMAIDTSTFGSSVATNVNAYCAPNDGIVGDSNLETAMELGLETVAEDIEVESATVDGLPAGRATYTLDMAPVQGFGVQYMFLNDDDVCWVTFTGAEESAVETFEQIAATIAVL